HRHAGRDPLPRPRDVPRSGEQVPADHQRGQPEDHAGQGQGCGGREDDQCQLHRDDLRVRRGRGSASASASASAEGGAMTRRRWFWLTTVALLALVAAVAAPNAGATERPPQSATGRGKSGPEKTQAAKEPDDSTVEQILRQQEALITGARFEYDPGNRRDP